MTFAKTLSMVDDVFFGVPQGSVLGPILFILYTSDVFRIIEKFGFKVHAFADDIQIISNSSLFLFQNLVQRFLSCLSEIDGWMSSHRLKLNQCKTQLLPVGTWQQMSKLDINSMHINGDVLEFCPSVTNLGFVLDTHLMMNKHISSLVCSCSFQLRRLRMVRRSLEKSTIESLMHAFVNSRLDYCNSLFYLLSKKSIYKLQSIQNRAAKIVEGGLKFNHVTPILRKLHWLPVDRRIVYKIPILVFKCVNGVAPEYLMNRCVPGNELPINYCFRSSESNLLPVPSARLLFGSKNFYVAGPMIWNSLPRSLRQPGLKLIEFRRNMKTHLYDHEI